MDGSQRERGEIRIAEAALRIAQNDPRAAAAVLAPVIDGSAPLLNAHLWEVHAFLLQAIACDALGDASAARRALERALDRAEPESLLFPFLFVPAPELLDTRVALAERIYANAPLAARLLKKIVKSSLA
jgi:LuxR family maltose regulon positive regulatory protein